MQKRNVITLVILGLLFVLIIVLSVVIYNSDKNKEKTEYKEIQLLKDESTFFSISNNINEMYNYYATNNMDGVYNCLDENYINNNNITIDNIENKFNSFKNKSYLAKEIYVISNKNFYKYYVKGTENNNAMDEQGYIVSNGYYIVNYDINTGYFNIDIIDLDKYDKGIKQSKQEFNRVINKGTNIFKYANLSEEAIALIYFNDFKNNIINNSKYVYDHITNDTKNRNFPSFEEFNSYINNNLDSIYNMSFKEYKKQLKSYNIVDNHDNEYLFNIKEIMNYSVSISLSND